MYIVPKESLLAGGVFCCPSDPSSYCHFACYFRNVTPKAGFASLLPKNTGEPLPSLQKKGHLPKVVQVNVSCSTSCYKEWDRYFWQSYCRSEVIRSIFDFRQPCFLKRVKQRIKAPWCLKVFSTFTT